jgi:hypothetical protein
MSADKDSSLPCSSQDEAGGISQTQAMADVFAALRKGYIKHHRKYTEIHRKYTENREGNQSTFRLPSG